MSLARLDAGRGYIFPSWLAQDARVAENQRELTLIGASMGHTEPHYDSSKEWTYDSDQKVPLQLFPR